MLHHLTSYLAWHGFHSFHAPEGALPFLVISQWIEEETGQMWWALYLRHGHDYVFDGNFEAPEHSFWAARTRYGIEMLRPVAVLQAAFPTEDCVVAPEGQAHEGDCVGQCRV